MHPHRMDDRGSAKHLWAAMGVSTPIALCGRSPTPRVARVWPRLLRGSAYQKSQNLKISRVLGGALPQRRALSMRYAAVMAGSSKPVTGLRAVGF
jgi:hypothetical protein